MTPSAPKLSPGQLTSFASRAGLRAPTLAALAPSLEKQRRACPSIAHTCHQQLALAEGIPVLQGMTDVEATLKNFMPVFVFTDQKVKMFKGIHEFQHCDYQTGNKITIQNHSKTHTGEKPSCCNLCAQKFFQKGTLR